MKPIAFFFVTFCLSLTSFAQTSKPSSLPAKKTVPSSRPTSQPRPKMSAIQKRKYNQQMTRLLVRIGQLLGTFLMESGRDPKNPWLLSHSLLAFGKDLKLKDGTKVVDHIVQTALQKKEVGGRTLYYFPTGNHEKRIEPHPHMHLKNFLGVGLPMNYSFPWQGKKVTLQEIFESALGTFPTQFKDRDYGKLAWLLQAMNGRMKKNEWIWSNANKESVRFFRIIWQAFHYLDKHTTFLRTLQRKKIKTIPKLKLRGQYIYGEPCGGFHLIQALLPWMKKPEFRNKLDALLNAQIELLFYRFQGEARLYQQLFKRFSKNAGYRFIILLQQMKFAGHWLETIAELSEQKLFVPSKSQQKIIRDAVQLLSITVLLIDKMHFFDPKQLKKLKSMNKQTYQFYLDLLGDAAHSLHAIQKLLKNPLYLR